LLKILIEEGNLHLNHSIPCSDQYLLDDAIKFKNYRAANLLTGNGAEKI